jgi:AbrB family looped-hinge helix DNA binding protein
MVGIKLKSRIGEKGQVVIPKPLRDQFGLRPLSDVWFHVENGKAVLEKVSPELLYQDFVSAVEKKIPLPKKIDWDEEYYSET